MENERVNWRIISEAILEDAQMKVLNQRLNELIQYNSPKHQQQTNGQFMAVNSVRFDEAVEKIKEQLVIRQKQIISYYTIHPSL